MVKKTDSSYSYGYDHRSAKGQREKKQQQEELLQQKEFDKKLKRMSDSPGLNAGNRHRQQTCHALVGLMDCVTRVSQRALEGNFFLQPTRGADASISKTLKPKDGGTSNYASSDTQVGKNNTRSASWSPANMMQLGSLLALIRLDDKQAHNSSALGIKKPLSSTLTTLRSQPLVEVTTESVSGMASLKPNAVRAHVGSDMKIVNNPFDIESLASNPGAAVEAKPLLSLLPLYVGAGGLVAQEQPQSVAKIAGLTGAATLVGTGLWLLYKNTLSTGLQEQPEAEGLATEPSISDALVNEKHKNSNPNQRESKIITDAFLLREENTIEPPAQKKRKMYSEAELTREEITPPTVGTLYGSYLDSSPDLTVNRSTTSTPVPKVIKDDFPSLSGEDNPLVDVMYADQAVAPIEKATIGSLTGELNSILQSKELQTASKNALFNAISAAMTAPEVKYAKDENKAKNFLYKVFQIISFTRSSASNAEETGWEFLSNVLTRMLKDITSANDQREVARLTSQFSELTAANHIIDEASFSGTLGLNRTNINIERLDLGERGIEDLRIGEQTEAINELLKEFNIVRTPVSGRAYINELVYFINHPEGDDYSFNAEEVRDFVFDKLFPINEKYIDEDIKDSAEDPAFRNELISNYIFNTVVGKSFYLWLRDIILSIPMDVRDSKVTSNFLFNKIKQSINKMEFSTEVKEYIYDKVILKQFPYLPIFGDYLNNSALLSRDKQSLVSTSIVEDIANLDINSAEFGLKYAGLSYLVEHGFDMDNIEPKHLELLGKKLYSIIDKGINYQWVHRYFINPAIIHKSLLSPVNQTDVPLAASQDEESLLQILLQLYNDYNLEMIENNEYIKFFNQMVEWEARPNMAERLVTEARLAPDLVEKYLFWNQDLVNMHRGNPEQELPDLGSLYREQTDKLKVPFANLIHRSMVNKIDSQSEIFQEIMHESNFYEVKRDKLREQLEKHNVSEMDEILNYAKDKNCTLYLCEHLKYGAQVLIISEWDDHLKPNASTTSTTTEKAINTTPAQDDVTQKNNVSTEDFVEQWIDKELKREFKLFDTSKDVEKYTRIQYSKTQSAKRSFWIEKISDNTAAASSLDNILTGIAEKSSARFIAELYDFGFGSTMIYGAYFKEFGLSLLPLRNAIVAFKKGNVGDGVAELAIDVYTLFTAGTAKVIVSGSKALLKGSLALKAAINTGRFSASIASHMARSLKTAVLNPTKLHKVVTNKTMRRLAGVMISGSDPGFQFLYKAVKSANKVTPYLQAKGVTKSVYKSYLNRETGLLSPILDEQAQVNYNLRVLNEKFKQKVAKNSPYQYVQNTQTKAVEKMIYTSVESGQPIYRGFDQRGLLAEKYYLDNDNIFRPLESNGQSKLRSKARQEGEVAHSAGDKRLSGQNNYSSFKSKVSIEKNIPEPGLDGSVSSKKFKKNLQLWSERETKPLICYELSIKAAKVGKSITSNANKLLNRTKNYQRPYKKIMDISKKTKKTHFDFDEITHSGFLNFKAKTGGGIQHTAYIHIGPDNQRLLVHTNGLSLDRELLHGGLTPESYKSANIYQITKATAQNINDYLKKNKLVMHYTPAYQVNRNADFMHGAPQSRTFVPISPYMRPGQDTARPTKP